MAALVLNLSVFYSLVKVTLMGLSATAHGALIGMTKLINWTPLFQGTGPQDFYYEHTIPQLTSRPFKWGLQSFFRNHQSASKPYAQSTYTLPMLEL